MNAKELYVRTIQDLKERCESLDRYDLLRASALMRQLLFDDEPLIHAANREAKMKIRFTIVPWTEPHVIVNESEIDISQNALRRMLANDAWVWSPIDPIPGLIPGIPIPTVTVKVDDFMKAICLRRGPTRITVRQVIKFCANVKGGVHRGDPDPAEAQTELQEMDKFIRVGGIEASLNVLPSIQRVLLAGLQPLTDVVIKEIEKGIAAGGI